MEDNVINVGFMSENQSNNPRQLFVAIICGKFVHYF